MSDDVTGVFPSRNNTFVQQYLDNNTIKNNSPPQEDGKLTFRENEIPDTVGQYCITEENHQPTKFEGTLISTGFDGDGEYYSYKYIFSGHNYLFCNIISNNIEGGSFNFDEEIVVFNVKTLSKKYSFSLRYKLNDEYLDLQKEETDGFSGRFYKTDH